MSKSTVAIVLLSLLLVLSLILTATGAWFTSSDKAEGVDKTINVGKVEIALSETTGMNVEYGSKNGATTVEKLVDKDTLKVTYGINNTSDVDIYYIIKSFSVKVYDYSTGTKGEELTAYEGYFGIADQFAASTTATKLENGADVNDATVTLTFDSDGVANTATAAVKAIYVELDLQIAAIQAAHIESAEAAYNLLKA